ncbi:MAG TPA: hypothetical protein VJK90_14690, partial [Acetobacteraceae bacterium]|nr:hypothetical protein [Acetobacteraceae bacterium]
MHGLPQRNGEQLIVLTIEPDRGNFRPSAERRRARYQTAVSRLAVGLPDPTVEIDQALDIWNIQR